MAGVAEREEMIVRPCAPQPVQDAQAAHFTVQHPARTLPFWGIGALVPQLHRHVHVKREDHRTATSKALAFARPGWSAARQTSPGGHGWPMTGRRDGSAPAGRDKRDGRSLTIHRPHAPSWRITGRC